jgi:hypothetical protein
VSVSLAAKLHACTTGVLESESPGHTEQVRRLRNEELHWSKWAWDWKSLCSVRCSAYRRGKPRCSPGRWWKRQMQSLVPRYLAALNRYAGQKVERIEFVIRQG